MYANNALARLMYTNLVKDGKTPLEAQKMVAAKYGAGQAGLTSKAGTFGGVGAREAPKTGWTK